MKKFDNTQILHLVDVATYFSASVFLDSKEMKLAVKELEHYWCKVLGPPAVISADLEFAGEAFLDAR